jgi:hypothetical protein
VHDDDATPGERLLYTLGQLYALSHRGELDVAPRDFDVLDLARILGVTHHLEFVTDGAQGVSLHFGDEVLVVAVTDPFPWRLLDLDTWALLEDAAALAEDS